MLLKYIGFWAHFKTRLIHKLYDCTSSQWDEYSNAGNYYPFEWRDHGETVEDTLADFDTLADIIREGNVTYSIKEFDDEFYGAVIDLAAYWISFVQSKFRPE